MIKLINELKRNLQPHYSPQEAIANETFAYIILTHHNTEMSLEIIIQEIKLFGKILANNPISQDQLLHQQRRFRITMGNHTYISKNPGFFISPTQLAFDQPFSLFYDNHSILFYIQVFPPHQPFNNTDLEQTLFAELDFSDISSMIGEKIETTVYNFDDQAIGKLTAGIQVFKKGPKFVEKVTSQVLFETVKEEKERQTKASAASKNIKNLMVNSSLTNTLMTVNYLQVKPQKQDQQIFNRDAFILMRYSPSKAYSKVTKTTSKQSVQFTDYVQFMKNDDVKFEFYFLFYDDLGNIVCKAKGEIKYIVFDETINNHTIVLFDRRSNIYGNLLVKFIEKEVEVVNIQNKVDKKLKDEQTRISQAIEEFNRFKFESKNNNRILSQKLREMELKALEEEEQKSKPLDAQQKKKKQEHSKFIQFLQKEVIKIQRQLKKREVEEKRDERKHMYQPTNHPSEKKDKKFNVSMNSSQFREGLPRIDQIDEAHIIPENVDNE